MVTRAPASSRLVILVKHALPVLEAGVAPRHWRLGAEGEAQAKQLAARLRPYVPFELVCSREPKAQRTAEVVGAELGVPHIPRAGFEEIDRPALPLLGAREHTALNAPIFSEPERRVVGQESGVEALERFREGLQAALAASREDLPLVVVTHGTVIALLVSAHDAVDGLSLWRELSCGSFVVLSLPRFELVGGVHRLD